MHALSTRLRELRFAFVLLIGSTLVALACANVDASSDTGESAGATTSSGGSRHPAMGASEGGEGGSTASDSDAGGSAAGGSAVGVGGAPDEIAGGAAIGGTVNDSAGGGSGGAATSQGGTLGGGSGGLLGVAGSSVVGDGGSNASCAAVKQAIGDIVVSSQATLAQVVGITELNGSLTLSGNISDLTPLTCLKSVSGSIVISGLGVSELTLPNLTELDGRLDLENLPALSAIRADALKTIGGLTVDQDPHLQLISASALMQSLAASGIRVARSGSASSGALALHFPVLTNTAGDLSLSNLPSLSRVGDFNQLSVVGGRLSIDSDDALLNLDDIANLKQVGLDISVTNSQALARIRLPFLNKVGAQTNASLTFDELPALDTLSLPNLPQTPSPGAFHFSNSGAAAAGPLTLDCSSLKAVNAPLLIRSVANLGALSFPALTTTTDLTLTSNAALSSLALPALVTTTSVTVQDDPSLTSIAVPLLAKSSTVTVQNAPRLKGLSLPTLTQCDTLTVKNDDLVSNLSAGVLAKGGTITVQSNASLASVALPALANANYLTFDSLPMLSSVNLGALTGNPYPPSPFQLTISNASESATAPLSIDLSALQAVSDFTLSGLAKLTKVGPMPKLTAIGVCAYFNDDPALTSISGFDNLKEIGCLSVKNDPVLTQVDLHAITTWTGYSDAPAPLTHVTLDSLPQLTNLDLRNLTSISGLGLSNLSATASSTPVFNFSALSTVGILQFQNIAKLQTLPNLHQVGAAVVKDLTVSGNPQLASLGDLSNLKKLSGSLAITNNPGLATCQAKQLAQSLSIAATTTISGNLADSCGN